MIRRNRNMRFLAATTRSRRQGRSRRRPRRALARCRGIDVAEAEGISRATRDAGARLRVTAVRSFSRERRHARLRQGRPPSIPRRPIRETPSNAVARRSWPARHRHRADCPRGWYCDLRSFATSRTSSRRPRPDPLHRALLPRPDATGRSRGSSPRDVRGFWIFPGEGYRRFLSAT